MDGSVCSRLSVRLSSFGRDGGAGTGAKDETAVTRMAADDSSSESDSTSLELDPDDEDGPAEGSSAYVGRDFMIAPRSDNQPFRDGAESLV